MMGKPKLTKEEKLQARQENKAWKEMVRKAKAKGAWIEESNKTTT